MIVFIVIIILIILVTVVVILVVVVVVVAIIAVITARSVPNNVQILGITAGEDILPAVVEVWPGLRMNHANIHDFYIVLHRIDTRIIDPRHAVQLVSWIIGINSNGSSHW